MSNIDTYTVTAEAAPIGVQLWPTASPKYAPNFTLAAVTVDDNTVTWTYESGTTRYFRKGEQIACGR